METTNRCLDAYTTWLVRVAAWVLGATAVLKLSGPLAVRFGLIEPALAYRVPRELLFTAAAVELWVVFVLSRSFLSQRGKLQLLFVLATAFISFRWAAFGGLFVPHCGCLGPLSELSRFLGRWLEGALVWFLLALFLGYPLQLLRDWGGQRVAPRQAFC